MFILFQYILLGYISLEKEQEQNCNINNQNEEDNQLDFPISSYQLIVLCFFHNIFKIFNIHIFQEHKMAEDQIAHNHAQNQLSENFIFNNYENLSDASFNNSSVEQFSLFEVDFLKEQIEGYNKIQDNYLLSQSIAKTMQDELNKEEEQKNIDYINSDFKDILGIECSSLFLNDLIEDQKKALEIIEGIQKDKEFAQKLDQEEVEFEQELNYSPSFNNDYSPSFNNEYNGSVISEEQKMEDNIKLAYVLTKCSEDNEIIKEICNNNLYLYIRNNSKNINLDDLDVLTEHLTLENTIMFLLNINKLHHESVTSLNINEVALSPIDNFQQLYESVPLLNHLLIKQQEQQQRNIISY